MSEASVYDKNQLMNLLASVSLLSIVAFGIGRANELASPADVEKQVTLLLKQMTLSEKLNFLTLKSLPDNPDLWVVPGLPRLGLPPLVTADGPFGAQYYGLEISGSTALAGGVTLAAAWDPALARRAGVIVGEDSRSRGIHIIWAPGVNLYRAPMAGRSFEYFGEDPFLAASTTVAYVEGVQSQGVCSAVKHYMGNNQEYDRHKVDSIIDERTMRELYLPAFEAAVKQADVCAVMGSYNLTNGEHTSQNHHINVDILKKDWGFSGILVSDGGATYDGVAAVNAGLDIEVPDYDTHMNPQTLLPAIRTGQVSIATIDDHVRRILRRTLQYGWRDRDQTDLAVPLYNVGGRAVALETARSGMVLLKNEGALLPLDKGRIKTVALIGPEGYPAQTAAGGGSHVRPFHAVSFLEGLANYLTPEVKLTYDPGLPSLLQIVHNTSFSSDVSGNTPGLKLETFTSNDLSGPSEVGIDEHVDYIRWYEGKFSRILPERIRSARWTGYYRVRNPGVYEVFLNDAAENGASRLFVDDRLAVDNWAGTKGADRAVFNFEPGPHKVQLEFRRILDNESPNIEMGVIEDASIVTAKAKALAAQADVVIVAVGFSHESEGEGGDRNFHLPPGQDELIRAMLQANKKVIIAITSGGGTDMNAWIEEVPAVLQTWYPGQEGGTALAQLLFGEYSPSGKLPMSFERHFEDNPVFYSYYPNAGPLQVQYSEGLFLGYRYYDKSAVKPLFPFGFGLSYTTFKYGNLAISHASTRSEEPVMVSFDITNTGQREGAEIAELYVGDTHARVPRPIKELKGFAKVNLMPAETKRATITLDRRAFSYYDVGNKQWRVDAGNFGILIGSSSERIELKGSVTLTQ